MSTKEAEDSQGDRTTKGLGRGMKMVKESFSRTEEGTDGTHFERKQQFFVRK